MSFCHLFELSYFCLQRQVYIIITATMFLRIDSVRLYALIVLSMPLVIGAAELAQPAVKLETTSIGKQLVLSKLRPNTAITNGFPFESGEYLKFKIKFAGITAGTATISVRPLAAEKVEFKLTARSAPWMDKFYRFRITLLSESLLESYQTLRYTEDKMERKRVYYNVQDFEPNHKRYNFSYLKNNALKSQHIDYTDISGGMSILAAFFFIRTTSLDAGEQAFTNCFFRDHYIQIGAEAIRRETIKSKFGKRETVIIHPLLANEGAVVSEQEKMLIYLSDDITRIPLLVEIYTSLGLIRAVLTDYRSRPPANAD